MCRCSRSTNASSGPSTPGTQRSGTFRSLLAPGIHDSPERPVSLDPRAHRLFELRVEPPLPRRSSHPETYLGVRLVRRVHVDAAQALRLVGRQDGVGERAPQLELLLMPAEVDEVLLDRRAEPGVVLAARVDALLDREPVRQQVVHSQRPQAEPLMLETSGYLKLVRDEPAQKRRCSSRTVPRCSRPSSVTIRPRGVRCRNPSWSRYGSHTPPIVSGSPPGGTERGRTPTGPP